VHRSAPLILSACDNAQRGRANHPLVGSVMSTLLAVSEPLTPLVHIDDTKERWQLTQDCLHCQQCEALSMCHMRLRRTCPASLLSLDKVI
jgi:hypothetical protein